MTPLVKIHAALLIASSIALRFLWVKSKQDFEKIRWASELRAYDGKYWFPVQVAISVFAWSAFFLFSWIFL